MNILHINSHDVYGARFNGYEMQKNIGSQHNVEMAVWVKVSSNSNVHIIPPNNRILKYLTSLIITLTARIGFDRLFGYAGFLLPFNNYFKKADIIHLHLIHNYTNFSILSLPRLSRKKTVFWTLHDPWAFTGGCEHSFDCDKWKRVVIQFVHIQGQTLFFKTMRHSFIGNLKNIFIQIQILI